MAKTDSKPIPQLTEKEIARFWSKVDRSGGPDACWPWRGKCSGGYGKLHISGREVRAHRVALFLRFGIDPFPLFACHACDERYEPGDKSYRKCCNGAHLVPGTAADNQKHMASAGRSQSGERHYSQINPGFVRRGEARGQSKLREQDVKVIREKYAQGNVSQLALASEFGVAQTVISAIIRRKKWAHVT